MSEENLAIVRTLFGAFFRRDDEVMTALMAPDVVWEIEEEVATQIGLPPELAGVYEGREGTRAFWSGWLSPWKDTVFDYELRAVGTEVAALIRNQRQWGRHSGVETQVPAYAWLYTIREGRISRARMYAGHESALEATDLSG